MDMQILGRQLRELIRTALGMPANSVRPANQHGPADDGNPFATVLLTPLTPTGVEDERYVNEATGNNVTETIVGQRSVLASVQFYRGDAMTKAGRLWQVLSLSANLEKLQNLGIGLSRASNPRDLSAVENTRWESRAQIDIEFHLIAKESTSTATFGTFPVQIATETLTSTNEVHEP